MNYLAFDLGASSGKMFLGRWDGKLLRLKTVHHFDHAAIPLAGGLYWDFFYIFRNMNLGIQKAANLTRDRINSLGIDTFANDFSLISETGELLSPVRCYRDQRTTRFRDAIFSRMTPKKLYQATGNQIALFSTLMQLAAMREVGQGYVIDNAHKLLFLPDLLNYYISGEVAAEYTISSVSQMFDFNGCNWSKEVLAAYNIPSRLLGNITKPGTVIGNTLQSYRQAHKINDFRLVAVCEHDTASAFLASTRSNDCAIISSGTWALVGVEVERPVITQFGFEHNIANEGGYNGHHRLVRNVMGAWLLQELRAEYILQGEKSYSFEELAGLAAVAKPFAYFIDVDDEQFYSPGEMKAKIQKICKKHYGDIPQTPSELVRCICESLAFKYRWAVEKLEQLTGKAFPYISIVGGGARDALTCQFTANAAGKPVIAGPENASALGNIIVQLIADGQINSIEEGREIIRRSFKVVHYQPQQTAMWDENYHKFKTMFGLG
jgi:sugar (pentulose or hexulose) kinase